jgi:hypothetical protein
MDLMRLISIAGSLSDQQLATALRGGEMPAYIAASEIQRRKDLRDRAQTEPPSVMEEFTAPVEGFANGGGLYPIYRGLPAGYNPGIDPEYDMFIRPDWGVGNFAMTPPEAAPQPQAQATGQEAQPQQQGGGGSGIMDFVSQVVPRIPGLGDELYEGVSDLFGLDRPRVLPEEEMALAASQVPSAMPVVDFFGSEFGYVPVESLPQAWQQVAPQGVIMDPTGAAAQLGAGNGAVTTQVAQLPDAPAIDMAQAPQAPSIEGAGGSFWTNPLDLPSSMMTAEGINIGQIGGADVATGLMNAGAGAFGSYAGSTLAKPGGEAGAAIGGTLGAALGGWLLGPVGAALGGLAGSGIGGQVGPAPTIGANFSSMGTFDPQGRIVWGPAGGDNGGTAENAQSFANWFSDAVAREAADRGYVFNPNMSGAGVRVGAYGNFSRTGETPGGFFYDIANSGDAFGGSPENYALRPGGLLAGEGIAQWPGGPMGEDQAATMARNAMADMVARGVYVPVGQEGPGRERLAQSIGADYGFYTPGSSFEDALAQRNWYVGTHLAQQQENARLAEAQRAAAEAQAVRGVPPPVAGQRTDVAGPEWNAGYYNEGVFFPTENPYATEPGYVPYVDTSGG